MMKLDLIVLEEKIKIVRYFSILQLLSPLEYKC